MGSPYSILGVGSISLLGLVGADVASTVHCAQTFPLVAPLSKFAVAFPLSYHYLGGLRHIVRSPIARTWIFELSESNTTSTLDLG